MTEKMWVIVGKHGLYTGTWLTRREAIAEHVYAVMGVSRSYIHTRLHPEQRKAWRARKALGDKCVRATITW